MNILVSTEKTQGQRKSDFCWCDEGEIVRFSFECAQDKDDIDGPCGCHRDLVGISSRKGTTTFMVAETDFTENEWKKLIVYAYCQAGYGCGIDCNALLLIAAEHPVGTILEKRGNAFFVRK